MASNNQLSHNVDAIRAIAFKEAADAGACFITEEWVSKKLRKSKRWVRENWIRDYKQVELGDIWIPGKPSMISERSIQVKDERLKTLMQTIPRPALAEPQDFSEPMPFIVTNPDGSFQMDETARKALSSREPPVCVVAIVGKYRTGKSFLMNRLFGKNSGFPLGGTIEAETKGIWMWQRRHPHDPSKTLVLLDTEGLFDVKKGDATHDMKLFTLAVLLSSCFVYNITGTIDDALIQQLHLVTQLTEHIKTKNTREETGADFGTFFPKFVLVVRDFFLKLEKGGRPCTADQYLDHALALKPGHGKDATKYNEPRECIKEFFTRRKCFVLPKPIHDDKKIIALENVSEGELVPEFLMKADEAVRGILQEAEEFRVLGNPVTGEGFTELTDIYVNAMNVGQVPCIESAVSLLRDVEGAKAKEAAIASYVSQMTETACVSMPMEAEKLSQLHTEAAETATQVFGKKSLFDAEGKLATELLDDLKLLSQEFVRQNEDESSILCKNQLEIYYSKIDNNISRSYYNKNGGYEEYKEDCDLANAQYSSYPSKGPMAQTVFTRFLQQRENVGLTILHADQALSAKEQELEKVRVEQEHEHLKAEAERERNEALRQRLEEEKSNHKRMVAQHMQDMERVFTEQEQNHQRAIREKERILKELQREGSERAAKINRDLKALQDEKQQMRRDRQEMREEIQQYERKNNQLLEELKNMKASSAATAARLQQMQAMAPPPPKKKKGCSIM